MGRARPPEGPPWDSPLAEAPLAFVDLEMSGLDVERDRVLEIAITREQGGALREWSSVVRPEPYVYGAGEIHGITEEEVQHAPTFVELMPTLHTLLDGAVFVAHGARWDLSFLRKETERAGTELPLGFYLDTLTLSRRAFSFETHSLRALAEELGLLHERAHRADADVVAMRALFWRCVEALGARTPRELFGVRIAEREMREEIKQLCEEAVTLQRPLQLSYRPSGKKPEELAFMVQSVIEDRVLGYEIDTRARRELRGARILAARWR